MKKILLLSTILAGSLFSATPSFSGLELKQINGSTGFSQIEAGEAIQVKLNNINEGGKTDTKRKVFASFNGIKGTGVFGVMTKDSYLWQSPKVAGTYTIGGYVENTDGSSAIVTQNIVVKAPYVATSGRNNCPINFIFVPNSQGLHGEAKGWCIMKYEASPYSSYSGVLGNGNNTVSYSTAKSGAEYATSKPKNPVYYTGSLENAKERCSAIKDSNGNSYSNGSIVSIDVWSKLVKNLYNVSYNWTEGEVTGGNLYIGHTDNVPAFPIQPSDLDTDEYYLTQNNSSETNLISISQKRTMKTSYNDVIWDIVGNNREYFRENYDNNTTTSKFYSFSAFDNTVLWYNSVSYTIDMAKINTDLSYKDPTILNNYEKLVSYNILGFKPNVISNDYSLVTTNTGNYNTTTLVSDLMTRAANKTQTFSLLFSQDSGQHSINDGTIVSMDFLKELGIGGYSNVNQTGTIGYNLGPGNPITYGGEFNNSTTYYTYPYGANSSFLSNTGLFAVNSGTDRTVTSVIPSNTTVANVGFRCMLPATN